MKQKIWILAAAFVAAMLITIVSQDRKISRLTEERDKYKENQETLLEKAETYRVRDSLNAARVGVLELSVKEFERYRAEDAALAKELKKKNQDLEALSKAQARTIMELRCAPRDTIVRVDSVEVRAKKVHCGDEWYTFDGLITDQEFTGRLETRDELIITETIRYRKILWWKTRKVLEREVQAASKNPHTEITGLEHIIIDK